MLGSDPVSIIGTRASTLIAGHLDTAYEEDNMSDRQLGGTATPKSKAIDELLTAIMGKDRVRVVNVDGRCMTCDNPDVALRDELSAKEYNISGMCQRCQDEVFH